MRVPIFAALAGALLLLLLLGLATGVAAFHWLAGALLVPIGIGVRDVTQRRQTVRRNFPVVGHFRYLLERVRPEINQYFIESNTDGTPFNREQRSLVYQRAKRVLDTLPFGTQLDVYRVGYEWIAHSIHARPPASEEPRLVVGADTCERPYAASRLNVSGMSYGSLSSRAVLALAAGARAGGFFVNTGEGGISPYHLRPGGDLVWQIGTGYFGCRSLDGRFDPERFAESAAHEAVKMIELKLSQGAKPGHGGILPAAKVSAEIAAIRGVPLGRDVLSPPGHSAFEDARGLLALLTRMRELSGGKPVGIKLCVGSREELLGLVRAMRETGEQPDFIAVDGGEGGTGAAPLEFSNSVGMPLEDGLVFVHNCLVGFGLRERVKLFASGKVVTGFDMLKRIALGADLCSSARAMMLAVGCIQARRCNSNDCPVGVATQRPSLVAGLDVADKSERVASYHAETVESFLALLGAAGLCHPSELRPRHVMRRVSPTEVRSYAEIWPWLEEGALLTDPVPEAYEAAWSASR